MAARSKADTGGQTPATTAAAKVPLPPIKRSIFKSKAEKPSLGKKALSLYRHNLGWGGEQEFSSRPSSREPEEKGWQAYIFTRK
jgi:hypothetical protein